MFKLSDFDFDLPPELIAQTALPERSASRLLEVGGTAGPARLVDRRFTELPDCLAAGDLLVFNDTKVLKARFFGQKASGGRIEVLIERVTGPRTALAQIRASKSPAAGATLTLADAFEVTVGERVEPFFTLHFPDDCLTLIERHGRLPLPPYIEHDPDATDETRYQTVFASNPGAVAAPTAGLHFDEALLATLRARGVETATLTLHVGAGTFQPVRVDNIADHRMHSEWYELTDALVERIAATRARGGRVIAVGTTSMRALEAAARDAEAAGRPLAATRAETDIFITPGYRFRVVDRLVTNFHLPKSTLLMLVSAFAGIEPIRAAYRHAIAERYRFFSYGDAMLLTRREPD
ncbi:tRNA preQ1(34) S-adenosylmethionine ribosyltransferase-isomerase QueA [Burkholderia glumae]|uniref:S-adenosylmethionine:tRNA ribosyltransferase-isomerase n=1 Tax=Burkholderia glumae TaxID=337 RepID=A0AAP9XZ33_BURGL|nr:tRNA preQ1(34) S-adenosylmethionine ribosyltransferase-isomerase QueA [Burkholderia glumae]ACR27802.1 S-adenosylmethionine:tRNA ribosyltransferase-isomerase [Burkholderia glumae BGR1]AJY65630.1 tRNA ribosyltransferase-isomerase [Burkholderia glumae LMG 2196 = ATCC 33617]KHJ62616.1 S-adenosylmethionine tRNA ribosyltransferase [Burkholderia glumae]MCM2481220.1 tRNA preQ1(34) S-adenosylmethionine ribosyltransferase-isomerase QueA [Burkholderia glumae]MCM2508641.1 tRNA preQ1(34) S-adenosylmethi